MRRALEQWVTAQWYRPRLTLIMTLLLPLSYLFRGLVAIRYCCYHLLPGLQKKVSVPVIVVGNISVGGTGKTPLIIELVNFIQQQGFKPGVLTRGYGATLSKPIVVDSKTTSLQAGDEAVMIANSVSCPVVAFPDRVRAAQLLIEQGCDVILSDDGLQHYRLQRDIEIIVIDGKRGLGNGQCLPAGPLREPAKRLHRGDLIVVNEGEWSNAYQMTLTPQAIRQVANPKQTISFVEAQQQQWSVLTAIGNPWRFINTLNGLKINHDEARFFPDHHKFSQEEVDFDPGAWVIMTHKDAVKCQTIVKDRHWYLTVRSKLEPEFFQALLQLLKRRIKC